MTALVVGNASYLGAELTNPKNDAEDFSKTIQSFGFSAFTLTDCNAEELEEAIIAFQEKLEENDVGLFYFAGHGIQIDGSNFVTCLDTKFTNKNSAKHSSFPLNRFIDLMEDSATNTNIIILDACRNNPYERAWTRGTAQKGLAPVYAPKGTIVAFATSPGETASDGEGRNGAYTDALLRHIGTPDISIEDMFKRVRNTLAVISGQEQTSWEHTSLTGEFSFNISHGQTISRYSKKAIKDELFAVDAGSDIGGLITALKSRNWYTQNPAFHKLSPSWINASDCDSLFVVGRNIYQAACGSSSGALNFIENFVSTVGRYSDMAKMALLDGMLFEVFFDREGNLRDRFKTSAFNVLFDLQKYPFLSENFDFIAECLIPFHSRFYVIPGKNKAVNVDVVCVNDEAEEGTCIKEVCFAGINTLKKSDKQSKSVKDETVQYWPMKLEELQDQISEEMVIPKRLLNLNFETGKALDQLQFPYRYNMRR